VGTGLNRHPDFPGLALRHLSEATGLDFAEATDHFEAQGARDAAVEAHGGLKTIAVSLAKIANDLRWLGSGPRAGLGEVRLPAVQPGSSIMPGKVNPVLCESVVMVAAAVQGHDVTVGLCGAGGHLELNATMPVMAWCLLSSAAWLAGIADRFEALCVRGITADRERCEATVEGNLSLATALVPHLGYDLAAEIAEEAHATGRTVREVAAARGVLPEDELSAALDAIRMTEPGFRS
jgi:fumarate hydratase class II